MGEKDKTLDAFGLFLEELNRKEGKYNDYEYPRVSVIIPIFNDSVKIPLTLESVLDQSYPDFEVIIVDAGSTDRSLKVVKNYRSERIRLFSSSGYQRYEMLNKGISQATGEYTNCLFPGDFYIHNQVLRQIMEFALDDKKPDLAFCGTLLRDGKNEPKIMLRPWSKGLLKRGRQPTSLQSCWFQTDTLRALGKFNTAYAIRGGYELMCRFCLHSSLRNISTTRVLTDYDLRLVTRKMVVDHFRETFWTVRKYFGFLASLRWLFIQKDISRIFKIWWRKAKTAFIGS